MCHYSMSINSKIQISSQHKHFFFGNSNDNGHTQHKSNYWWQGAFEEVETQNNKFSGSEFWSSIDKSTDMEVDNIIYLEFVDKCFCVVHKKRKKTRIKRKEIWRPCFMLFSPGAHKKVVDFLTICKIKSLTTWLVPYPKISFSFFCHKSYAITFFTFQITHPKMKLRKNRSDVEIFTSQVSEYFRALNQFPKP